MPTHVPVPAQRPAAPAERARTMLREVIRSKVAGPDADAKAHRIWEAEGPRWFSPTDPIAVVQGDAAMYAGGIRALLMQSLHPGAMAGVAGHSGYKGDPWGRLQRTSEYIATTTFGRIDDAEALIGRIRGIHERVRGKDHRGRPYRASDPHLLLWVHCAEVESFLASYRLYGARRMTPREEDAYVAQAALPAELLGVVEAPRTVAGLEGVLATYRDELEVSPPAVEAAEFLLREPPLPASARLGYWMLAAGALGSMPVWAREMLSLPRGERLDSLVLRPAGRVGTTAVRWAFVDSARGAERR